MTGNADPRGSWAFRRRVALAQRRAGSRPPGRPLWPSLMVIGAFLVVSLFGLWAMLPAWLHALGLLAFLAGLAGRRGARAMPGAGRITAPACAAWSRSTGCRTSRCARSAIGSRAAARTAPPGCCGVRHLERLRQAVRNLKVGPPRSDLPRRDPWALRAALVLLLLVALRPGRRHGAGAAGAGVRARPRRPHRTDCRSRPPCGSRRRPTPGGRRCAWRQRRADRRSDGPGAANRSRCPPAARCWPSCTTSAAPSSASLASTSERHAVHGDRRGQRRGHA